MHNVVSLAPGPLYLYCIVVFVWELDRQTRGRTPRKPWLFSAVVAIALIELLDG